MTEPPGHCTIWQQYIGTLCYITTLAEKSNNLHEWTPCEGWSNCSCSRVRLCKQGATFKPVVLQLICSCEASDQWDTTTEEFWQSGITSFPCRNCLSVALLMYHICIVQFYVFSTVHHSIELFHQPTLMNNFYSLTICLLHYYPRHVSSINMPIFRRKNCIHTASGIFALCKRLPSTLVGSGL